VKNMQYGQSLIFTCNGDSEYMKSYFRSCVYIYVYIYI